MNNQKYISIYFMKDPFPKNKRMLLFIRSLFGASNLLTIFYGLKHMPMADVNMISAGSPIWVVIFARIFLKEPLAVFDIANVFVTLLGILFIIRYNPEWSTLIGRDPRVTVLSLVEPYYAGAKV